MENRSDKDHKLSQGTYRPEKHQEGLGKPDLCEVDQDKLAVGLEEPSELSMTVGEGDTGLVFLNSKDIFSLKTEELKAELDKRRLKKSGNKCTLVECLRAAMISEHISQTFEDDHKHSQLKEKPIMTNSHIHDQELYSFIETKVREVCLHEIEKLKSEASSSYANETILLLQKENGTLKQRLRELESRHTSMKQEATTLVDETKSLMTAIRLLNNELQTVLKADDLTCSRPNERRPLVDKEWQVVGAKMNKEKDKTRESDIKELEAKIFSLETRAMAVEDENKSLKLVMKIVTQENETEISSKGENDDPRDNCCLKAKSHKNQPYRNGRLNSNEQMLTSLAGSPVLIQNRFQSLENTTETEIQRGQITNNTRHTTIIAGDSILKNLRSHKMSKVSQGKVYTFSGCTTKDLCDNVKPILRKKPDRLIIHVGTNSLRESLSPTACAQEIIELARSAKNSSPDTDIVISYLIARSDDSELSSQR
ncbi:ELKS/Rab6-interacting/CAST family member 1-like [Montipora foliosa]|uniref:ELKS/Rab6-interacting/CAST family member 1-like n=1 Tax=Montipora foliosa TaxID=591990 RepID=UPI0035F1B1A5